MTILQSRMLNHLVDHHVAHGRIKPINRLVKLAKAVVNGLLLVQSLGTLLLLLFPLPLSPNPLLGFPSRRLPATGAWQRRQRRQDAVEINSGRNKLNRN